MNEIIIAVVVLAGIGLVAGILLSYFSKVFHVEQDPRIEEINENILPGANCGACGYAGCIDFARAVIEAAQSGEKLPECPPGGPDVAQELASFLGLEHEGSERKTALVKCAGTSDRATERAYIRSVHDCRTAALFGGNKECQYGCMGYGDCVKACPYDAIHIYQGNIAIVDPEKCTACGICVDVCPNDVIELVPANRQTHVLCNSQAPTKATRSACSVGCIGCKLCQRKDKDFSIENNLAIYNGNKGKEEAAYACPNDVIVNTWQFPVVAFVESTTAREKFAARKAEYKAQEKAKRKKAAAARKAKKAAAAKKKKEDKSE
ncbi:MAG: RnfABCDGE type electron transport complex subunit B [Myxococcota bacterium]